jgi:hypothetical protein
MDELNLLIARLAWPSTSVRWWTMQELAERLAETVTRATTQDALIERLRACRLEAEVVEVLCIFWIASKALGYTPLPALTGAITKPSLLATLLMESLGFAVADSAGDLVQLPAVFEIPEDFPGGGGIDVPRIFFTRMERLEDYARLPFVAQMAFEWSSNQVAYPDAPIQSDAHYFLRPLDKEFVAHLSTRTALRAISAYLRALGVGVHCWEMPSPIAKELSLQALPVHPTLAFLRPRLPDWYPTMGFDFTGDAFAAEAWLRAVLSQIEQKRPGDELIALSTPLLMSVKCCIEVSMVRWSQGDSCCIAETDLSAHLDSFWSRGQLLSSSATTPFSTSTSVCADPSDELLDEASASWPLAGLLDYERIGYLQHDLYPSRLFVPTMSGATSVEIQPFREQLAIQVGDNMVAELLYWNAGWAPVRPSQLGGNCGTALVSRGTGYRQNSCADLKPLRSFYLWRVRTLCRNDSFGRFDEGLRSGVWFI